MASKEISEAKREFWWDVLNIAVGVGGMGVMVVGRNWLQRIAGAGLVCVAVRLWQDRHPQKLKEIELRQS